MRKKKKRVRHPAEREAEGQVRLWYPGEPVPYLLREGHPHARPDWCQPAGPRRAPSRQRRLPSGLCQDRRDARQLVSHNHFTVNGKRVNIPSYQVKPGDVIEVIESSRSSVKFSKLLGEEAPVVLLPSWLERDKNALKGTVTKLPVREDIDVPIAEHLIVELYSK